MLTSRLHDLAIALTPLQFWCLTALLVGALAVCIAYCFGRLRVLRTIEDTPTSRVRSAAQGYVELDGKVETADGKPLRSPLQDIPCVWWSYRIEDRDVSNDRAGGLVECGTSHECFLMRDDTGACVIDPDQARIVGVRTKAWTRGSRRFEEALIRPGQKLYALGLFRTPDDEAGRAELREVGTLISTWQLDRLELGRRFDANRDGRLDDAEWAAAWAAATAEVRGRRPATRPDEMHVLCRPADRRPFVLSVLGERALSNRFWFESLVSLLLAGILAALLIGALRARGLL